MSWKLTIDASGAPNLRQGYPNEKEFYRRALNYYQDDRLAESALANYRKVRERVKGIKPVK